MGSVVKKVMFVGRATTFMVGLAVILALTVGVASAAFGANGGNFLLGSNNVATLMTRLAGANGVDGTMFEVQNNNADADDTALSLKVQPAEPPMTVNSDTQVANLNADKVDGKSANEIGVNGLTIVSNTSPGNSNSPKSIPVSCPPGKVVVGTGYELIGNDSGAGADVVMDDVLAVGETQVVASALEEEPTSASWAVTAQAICATAP